MRLRRHRASEESGDTGIDLAPMLDFVLTLLIFFIITAVFVKEVAIPASQPASKAAESKEAGSIAISIRTDGSVFIAGRQIDLRAVRASIERLHAQRPDDVVVIASDGDAQTGILVQVMDQVRQGGITNISIAASSPN